MDIIKSNIRAVKWISNISKWYFPIMVLDILFNNLSPFINIYMSAQIVNEISKNKNADILFKLVLLTILINLIIGLISVLLSRIDKHTSEKFGFGENRALLNKFLGSDFEKLESGEILSGRWELYQASKINGFGISAMLDSSRKFIDSIINIMLSVILMSSLIITIINNPGKASGLLFVGIIFVLIILFIFSSFRNSKILAQLGKETSSVGKKYGTISEIFGEAYQSGKEYRIYNMNYIIDDFKEKKLDMLKKNNKKYWYGYRNTQISEVLLSYALNFFIYAFVCINALNGLFGIGSVIMYVGYIQRFVSAVKDMAGNIAMFRMNVTFLNNYLDYIQVTKTIYNGTLIPQKSSNNIYEIEFHNVYFKYPSAENYALKNFSLKFNVGQRMAVVGMNGSGKTTMIKLLCRLYDPTDGKITLNGIDVRKYDYDEYISLFSVVFQDFSLFSFSLGQNISASSKYDSVQATKCLITAGLGDRLSNMPKGLETPLYKDFDDDGVEISGGESQKIALARALYKDAPFIILDEPTAALDPIAEFEIYSKFNEIVKDRTSIFISHRLSSCRFCNDIAVFHEGQLIQRGNHSTLISDINGKYHELWNAQAKYYNLNKKTEGHLYN